MKVEWLILADAAQVVGGKLYLLGGGWDRLTVNTLFPVDRQIAIAASFLIDWNETNERHNIVLQVEDGDGHVLRTVEGQMEAGRPPGVPVGQAQRIQVAAEFGMTFKAPGTYSISAQVEGQEPATFDFHVVGGPALEMGDKPSRGAA